MRKYAVPYIYLKSAQKTVTSWKISAILYLYEIWGAVEYDIAGMQDFTGG